MRAVDTNILVRLIARDDPDQVAAAERFIVSGAWVSHLALAETIWVLQTVYECPRDQQAAAIRTLLDHRDLTLEDPQVVEAALEHFETQRAVSFSDCLMLEMARKAGHTPLGTFDRALGRLPGAQRL